MHYEQFQDGSEKCIEDEIPFELPEGWEWARMFSLTQDLPYGTSKKSSSSGEIAVLRMGNLQQGEIDYSDLVYSSDKEDIDKYLLTYGDLLFNRTNSSEWVGKTAIYRGEIPAIYAGYLIRIRSFLDAEYHNSVMNSKYAKEICLLVKTDAVNQSNINATKLGRFLIPVPPLSEQIRISSMISEVLYWNNFIESNKLEIKQSIQQIKSKVLDLAIRGKLVPQNPEDEPASVLLERIRVEKEELIKAGKIKRNKKESTIFRGDDNSYYHLSSDNKSSIISFPFEIPNNWEWSELGNIAFVKGGKRIPKGTCLLNSSTAHAYIRVCDMKNHTINLHNLKYIDEDVFQQIKSYTISKDDLYITIAGTIGAVGIVPNELDGTNLTENAAKITNITINKNYLCMAMRSDFVQKQFRTNTYQVAMPKLGLERITTTVIPLPPLAEQKRIVGAIETVFAHLDEITNSIA